MSGSRVKIRRAGWSVAAAAALLAGCAGDIAGEMSRNVQVRDRVATFLGCALSESERQRVSSRCTFDYMKAHEEQFEMAPPTMFSVRGGQFLAGGKVSRIEDVAPEFRTRILEYCRRGLGGSDYPAHLHYPELTR